MKGNKKKGLTLLAAAIMSAGIAVATQAPVIVLADEGDPGMTPGASVLAKNAGQENAQIIKYGVAKYQKDQKRSWYVIGYDGSGNSVAARRGLITLLYKGASTEEHLFNSTTYFNSSNEYDMSDLRHAVSSFYFGGYDWSWHDPIEQKAVVRRKLEGGSKNLNQEGYDPNKVKGDGLTEYFWSLSVAEARELPSKIRETSSTPERWWLRSPGNQHSRAAFVQSDGGANEVNASGAFVGDPNRARPAFDLDINSVVLTSSAYGGKQSGEGADALTEVSPNTNNEWKLTIKDSARSTFTANVESYDGEAETVVVNYSGAPSGPNEYVSAVIKDSSDNIKYYGRLVNVTSREASSGTFSINLAGKCGEDDTLYVFSEQMNGDQTTDYASELIAINGYRVYKGANYGNALHCTVKLPTDYCMPGQIYTFETVPDKGYKADVIRISDRTTIDNTIEYTRDENDHNKFSFVMPKHDVTIYALASEAHSVNVGVAYRCSVKLPDQAAFTGEKFSFEIIPEDGCVVDYIRILKLGNYGETTREVEYERDENNTNIIRFTMPDNNIKINAVAEEAHASGGDEETTAPTTTPTDGTEAADGNKDETDPTTAQPSATPAAPTKAAASEAKSYAPASGSSAVKTQSVSTGDRNESIIWIPICAAAAAGIVLTAVIRRKRSQ